MVRIVEFDPAQCAGARAHPSQARFQFMLDGPGAFHKWAQPYSALEGDDLIAIGGWVLVKGTWGGWVLFTAKITPARFLVIHRTAARFLVCLEQINETTLTHIDPDNPQAMRWAGLLGLETRRTDVLADGRVDRRISCRFWH